MNNIEEYAERIYLSAVAKFVTAEINDENLEAMKTDQETLIKSLKKSTDEIIKFEEDIKEAFTKYVKIEVKRRREYREGAEKDLINKNNEDFEVGRASELIQLIPKKSLIDLEKKVTRNVLCRVNNQKAKIVEVLLSLSDIQIINKENQIIDYKNE